MLFRSAVGSDPFGVAVSQAGNVYVANLGSDTVSVINPATNTVTAITVGNGPDGVAASPTGPQTGDIYVTNDLSNTVTVIS